MDKDYECYLLGCRSAGLEPLEHWRFKVLQEEFLRQAAVLEQESGQDRIPSFALEQLVAMI
ncbi:MAG: hypothetical protein M3Y13_08305, partial [Armatimonadota bacterium]|nr:hypothetical protein [Armatimonadota bacterium]